MKNDNNAMKLLYFLILCIPWLLAGCEDKAQQAIETPLRQVRSILVNTDTNAYARTFSGTLHAAQYTKLSFQVSGAIKDIAVNIGDKVRKGAVVAVLDSLPYDLQAQQAHAALINSQAQFRNAKSNYERVKNLYAGSNTSKNELDNARANSEALSASVQSAQKVLEIARLNVAYTQLKTEGNCAIASVDAEEGENVSSGTQIFGATCGDELEVRLNIPESVIGSIKKNMPVTVRFSALQDKIFKATVREVGVSTVGGSTTFPVRVMLNDSSDLILKAGLSADVMFTFPGKVDSQSAIIVPPFSVGEDEAGRFVFILEQKEHDIAVVRRQTVTIGSVLQNGIEVITGLKPHTRVVTAGVSVLRDGVKVKYTND